jgi:branched-chain amino acid transport system ATP-binding protein
VSDDVIVEVRRLDVRYRAMLAVEGVSLRVPAGKVTVLLGANGAGKSSLLKAVAGLVRPSAGELLYRGRPYQGKPAEFVTRSGIVLVPEGRHVFGAFSVEENLKIGSLVHRDRATAARQRELILALFPDLARRLRQRAETLSGGQQQMLAIGRALMGKPDVLLLDEPSLGVSPKLTFEIYDALHSLAASGTTVLLVEQYAALALELAAYGYVLKNGVVALEGPAAELSGSEEVRSAYLGG